MANEEFFNSVKSLSSYLINRWPQIQTDFSGGVKKVDYVIVGSLASKLLSQSNSKIQECLLDEFGNIELIREFELKEETKKLLMEFNNPSGDVDYAIANKDYGYNIDRILCGRVALLEDLPEDARGAIKNKNPKDKALNTDKVNHCSKAYIIEVDDRKYAITSLDLMLAYKTLNVFDQVDNDKEVPEIKKDKMKHELRTLYEALTFEGYDMNDLSELTRSILFQYIRDRFDTQCLFRRDKSDFNKMVKDFFDILDNAMPEFEYKGFIRKTNTKCVEKREELRGSLMDMLRKDGLKNYMPALHVGDRKKDFGHPNF